MPPSRIPIVGGPRDGEYVPWVGPRLREPIARRVRVATNPLNPYEESFPYEVREYTAYQWCDETGKMGWRYVLDDLAKGLGANDKGPPERS